MELITIYRIQDSSGHGPWWTDNDEVQNYLNNKKYDLETHVPISVDIGLRPSNFPYCMYCGCLSLEDLRYWFDSEFLDILADNDFVIMKYVLPKTATKIGKSGKQVAFDKFEIISEMVLDIEHMFFEV